MHLNGDHWSSPPCRWRMSAVDRASRDRLGTSAESRRDDSLHQIDRRRALFGERLRQTVQQVEHDELEVIEMTPTKGKKAA